MPTEVHSTPSEYGVYYIPADTDQPMSYKVIATDFRSLQRLVGGGYIEVVRTDFMPDLKCGCRMVMVVDEEGLLKGLPRNLRASTYYPYAAGIAGDAFLIGEGPVTDSEGLTEVDFYGLPPEFHNWSGPGDPIPNQLSLD